LSRVRAADPPVRVLEHGVGSAPEGDGDLSRSGTFCPNACPARRARSTWSGTSTRRHGPMMRPFC